MPDDNVNPVPMSQPAAPTATDDMSAMPIPEPVPSPADDNPVVEPTVPPEVPPADQPDSASIYAEVASKIAESKNILVALSSDPSVDEMSAAIGLSIYLGRLGKRATAIYSGATPNALEFLKPEETFESTADTLQDFVIALNKDKADHLRYKLDGDFVKIYITPYKARITKEDLDFSYGDFNVDLVLALDVANGIDLDSALREHGRIMHDAVIVNISTGKPGKFGEIEWSDKTASSVSEMIANLLFSIKSDVKIEKEEATAFLTGIVAATNRFSNATTTPETMKLASKLMESGANQQLVSQNITPDVENEFFSISANKTAKKPEQDPTKLEIEHDGEGEAVDEDKEVSATVNEKESTLLDDLKAAEASLAQTGAETTPESDHTALKIDSATPAPAPEAEATPSEEPEQQENESLKQNTDVAPEPTAEPESSSPAEPVSTPTIEPSGGILSDTPKEQGAESASETSSEPTSEPTPAITPEPTSETVPEEPSGQISDKPEKVLQPSSDLSTDTTEAEQDKYGQMLEDALNSVNSAPEAPSMPAENPATMSTPSVPDNPEINGVPEINYMPMPGDEILPPPPTPPIDPAGGSVTAPAPMTQPIEPAAPTPEPAPTPLGPQPAMQDQVYAPQASDPGAFKIPGM